MGESTLHLRGLPFRCSEDEIVTFLDVDPNNILSVNIDKGPDGRPSGDGYVTVADQATAQACLQKHKCTMEGYNRYVEIFNSDRTMGGRGGHGGRGGGFGGAGGRGGGPWDGVIKCRGCPWGTTENDIADFFGNPEAIAPNGITVCLSDRGDCSGEVFVQFNNYDAAEQALLKDRQSIKDRYVELFKSNNNDVRKALIDNQKKRLQNGQAPQNNLAKMFGGNMMDQINGAAQPVAQMPQMPGAAMMGGTSFGAAPSAGGPMKASMAAARPSPYPTQQNNAFGQFNGGLAAKTEAANGAAPAAGGDDIVRGKLDPNCPFKHVIGMNGVEQGVSNNTIQEHFRPHKAIAVNNHGNGYCDVAFKSHKDAEDAYRDKNGKMLGTNTVTFVLKSDAPEPTGWNNLPAS